MVARSRPRGIPYGMLGAGLASAAMSVLTRPSAGILRRADDDPSRRLSFRPRPLPDGPCSYRATGSKRSRRRRQGKAEGR